MSAFIAPVVVHRASRRPRTISTSPPLSFSVTRVRLSSMSWIASAGTTPVRRSVIDSIVSGPAVRLKTPTAIRSAAGMARNA